MTDVPEIVKRNATFADGGFDAALTINPSGNMMVVGCVDPRVDPGHVLGLANGEAAIIRNVGGRITPATLRTMAMLGKVGAANSDTHRPGDWNLVILHHTDCGMTDLAPFPDLLAEYFEISADELPGKSVNDPIGRSRSTSTSSGDPSTPQRSWFPGSCTTSPPVSSKPLCRQPRSTPTNARPPARPPIGRWWRTKRIVGASEACAARTRGTD